MQTQDKPSKQTARSTRLKITRRPQLDRILEESTQALRNESPRVTERLENLVLKRLFGEFGHNEFDIDGIHNARDDIVPRSPEISTILKRLVKHGWYEESAGIYLLTTAGYAQVELLESSDEPPEEIDD